MSARGFLFWSLWLGLGVAGACGGKAVIDPPGQGSGGAGGTSVSSSSSSSTVTGVPACNCQQFCAFVEPCGLLGVECLALCESAADPEFLECVCNSGGDCQVVNECGFGGPGSGSTGSGGGSPPSGACINCISLASQDEPCEPLGDQCGNTPGCVELANCLNSCGWSEGCFEQCEPLFPAGVGPLTALMQCAACNECSPPCAASDLHSHYCAP